MCLISRGGDRNFIFPRGEIYPESSSLVGGVEMLRAFYTDGSLVDKCLVFVQNYTFYTSSCLENIKSSHAPVICISSRYGTGAFSPAPMRLRIADAQLGVSAMWTCGRVLISRQHMHFFTFIQMTGALSAFFLGGGGGGGKAGVIVLVSTAIYSNDNDMLISFNSE